MKVTADGSMRMTREHIGGFENRMAGRTGTDARKEFRYLSFGMEMFLRYARSGFYEFDDAKMVFLEQLEDQERFRETTVLREREVRDLLSFYFQTKEQSIEKHWYYRQAARYVSRQIEMKLRELRYLDASAAGRLEQIYHTDLTQFSEKEKKLFLESLVQGANAQRQNSRKKGILPGAERYIQADRTRPYQRMSYQAKRLPDAKTLFYQSAQKQWKEYEKEFVQNVQRQSMSNTLEISGNISLPENRLEEKKVPEAVTVMPEQTAGGIAGNYDADHARVSLEHFYQSILEKRQEGKWEEGYDILSDAERVFLKQGQQEEENGERIKQKPVLTPKELQSFVEHAGEGMIGAIRDALSVETRQEIEWELHLQTEEWKTEETDSLVLLREFLKKELVTWKNTGEKAGENTGEEKTRIGQEKEGGAEKHKAEQTEKTEASRREEKRKAEQTEKTEVFRQEEKRIVGETGKTEAFPQEKESQKSALYAEKGSRKKEDTEGKTQERENIWQEELQKAVKNVLLQDLELYRENFREWERKVQTERFFERKEETEGETGRKFPAEEKEIVQRESFVEGKELTEKQETEEREKTQKKLSVEEKEKEQKGLLTEEDKNQKNIAAKEGEIFTKKLESETAENVLKGFRSVPERTEGQKIEHSSADMTIRPLEHFYQNILKKQEKIQEEGYESFSDSERVFLKQGQQEEEKGERIKRQQVLTPKELQSFVEHAGEGLIGAIRDALSVETRQEIERELHLQTEEWKTEETDSLVLLREFLKKEIVTWKDTGENAGEETTKTRIGQRKEDGAEKRKAEQTEKTEVFRQEEKRIVGETGKTEAFPQEKESQKSVLYAEKGSRKKEDTEGKIQKKENIWQEELRKAVKNVLLQDLELYRENLREWERKVQTERFFDRKEEAKEETGRKFPAEEKEIVQRESFAEGKELTEKQETEEREKTQKKLSAEEKEQKRLLTEEDKNQKNIVAKDGEIFTKKLESETAENVLKGFRSVPEGTEGQKIEHSSADMTIRPLEHFYQSILKKQEETQEEEGYGSFSDSERVFLKQGQPEEESGRRARRQLALAPEELQSFLENASEGLVKEIQDSFSERTRQEVERQLNLQAEEGKTVRNRLVLLREFLKKELSVWKDTGKTAGENAGEKTETFPQAEKRTAEGTGKTQISRQEQESQTSTLYAEKGSREKEDTERKIEKREEILRKELEKAVRNVLLQDLKLYRENWKEWEREKQTERFFDRKEETLNQFPVGEKEVVQRESFMREKESVREESFAREKETVVGKTALEERESASKEPFAEEKEIKWKESLEGETEKERKEIPTEIIPELQGMESGDAAGKLSYTDMTSRPLQYLYQEILNKTPGERTEKQEGYERVFDGNGELVFFKQAQEEETKEDGKEFILTPKQMDVFLSNVRGEIITDICNSLSKETRKELEERLLQTEELKAEKAGQDRILFLMREFLRQELSLQEKEKAENHKQKPAEKKEEELRQETIRRRTELQEVVRTVFLQDLKQYQGSPEEWKLLQKKEDNVQKKLEEKRTIENFYEEQISEKEKTDSRKETGKKGQKEMPPDLMNRPLQYMRQTILEKTHGENDSAASGYEEFSEAERVLLRQEEKETFRKTEQALEYTKELEELMTHTEEHVLENVRKSLNPEAPQEGNRKREAENVLKEISVLKTESSTVTEHLLKTSAYLQPSLKSLSNGNMAKQIMEQADPEKMVFPHREEEHFPWEYAGNLSFSEGGNSEAGYEHMQTGEEKNYRIFHENITKQFSEILIKNPMLWKQIGQETEIPETIVKEAVKNQGTVDRLVTHLEKESVFKESIRQEIREREKEDRVLVYQKLPQERNVQEKHRQKAEEDIPGIPTVLREEVEAFGIVEKEREVSMQELEQRVEKQGEQIQQLLQAQKELIKQLSSKENEREMAKKTFRRYEERMLLERMRYGL